MVYPCLTNHTNRTGVYVDGDVSKYYFLDANCTDDADKELRIRVFRV